MNLYLYKGFNSETAIIDNSIKECTHIIVHEDVTTICRGAFTDCHNLISVVMFDNVRRIEEYAFHSCVNLKTIKFSKNLDYIGDYAFLKCYSIKCYSIPQTITSIGFEAFSENEELHFINVPCFSSHIMSNLPDLRKTSIYTVTAKKEGVTMRAAVTGEIQDRAEELFERELFDRELVSIVHLGRSGGAMPKDVVGISLLKMWLCFHMEKYPLHKVCFCPSVTVEKLNKSIIDLGSASVKKIERFNNTTPLHMLAMNPHASETAFERLFEAWSDAIFKRNSLGETPLDCARMHNLKGLLTLIKCLCVDRDAMAGDHPPAEKPCFDNLKKRKKAK